MSLFDSPIDVETKPLFVRNIRKSRDKWKQNKGQRHDICTPFSFENLQTNSPLWWQNIDINQLA